MYAVFLTILFNSLLVKHVKTDTFIKVRFKEYSHTVFLHYPDRSGASEGIFCGGSLILARVIVTSAECLEQMNVKKWITAYFGSSRPSKARAKLTILRHKVHPRYNEDSIFHNLGVALLDKPPPLGPYIEKIILPIGIMHKKKENAASSLNILKVTEPPLAALVQSMHDRAKNSTNSVRLTQLDNLNMFHAKETRTLPEMTRQQNQAQSSNEAFVVVWANIPDLRSNHPLSALSSRLLAGYRVRLLPSVECNSLLYNLSFPADTICTKSKFSGSIYESPGSGLIMKKPLTQLIGIYSRFLRGISVFVNVDSQREWLEESTYELYQHACAYGRLSCSSARDSIESVNCFLS